MGVSEYKTRCLKKISANVQYDIINSIGRAESGHVGGSLSAKDILTSLYFDTLDSGERIMNYDPKQTKLINRERLVLSKGHSCPALYSVLSQAGYFSRSELDNLRDFGSILEGHPNMKKAPGIEMSTGSLGQGLSVGVGMSIAAYMDNLDYRTYVLIGDGESQEGQITEAAKLASNLELDNLCAIMDYNKLQIDGNTSLVSKIDPFKEWSAYEWEVISADGHDFNSLRSAFSKANSTEGKPSIIIADTVKGKGVSFMENVAKWHGVPPKGTDLENALYECEENMKKYSDFDEKKYIMEHLSKNPRNKRTLENRTRINYIPRKPNYSIEDEIPTRVAFGNYVSELGKANKDIVLVSLDLTGSVKATNFGLKHGVFWPREEELTVAGKKMQGSRNGRLILGGIAEANGASMAAGLSASGKYPIVASFDVFIGNKMNDQIRQGMAYPDLPGMFVGTHSGLGVEKDGATHQSIFAPINMVHLHGMRCFEPYDANQTFQCMDLAIESKKPAYLRLTRHTLPILNSEHICKEGEGAHIVKKEVSEKPEVVLISSGTMTHNALKAAEKLETEEGIPSRVINVYAFNTAYEKNTLDNLIEPNTGLLTVYDGGRSLLRDITNHRLMKANYNNASIPLGIKGYGASGDKKALYRDNKLDVASIVEAAKKVRINQKERDSNSNK